MFILCGFSPSTAVFFNCSKTWSIELIVNFKLTIGLNVSVNACLLTLGL